MIKIASKIIALPMILVFGILEIALYGVAWLYAHAVGILLWPVVICITLALFTKQWIAVGVFGTFIGIGVVLFFTIAWLIIGASDGKAFFEGLLFS